ncbi:hypothetical protein C2S52_012663 [Perilla frutescens var. hirtella]|nr:hypothetical protein C2S52_012663 [Perilla frutescens var. hirtella]
MPDLGRDCAHIIKRNLNRFPRILRWRVDDFYQYDDLLGYFTPEYAERLGIVSPSRREWEALQELGLVERHMSPPKLIVNPQVVKRKACDGAAALVEMKKRRVEPHSGLKERLRSARLKEKEKNVNVDSTAESKSIPVQEKGSERPDGEEIVTNVTLLEIDVQMKVLLRKMDLLETLIRRCKCCWKNFGESEAGDVNEDIGDGGHCDGRSPSERKLEEENARPEVGEAEEKCEGDGLVIGKTTVLDECLKPAAVNRKKGKKAAHGVGLPRRIVGTRSSQRLSKTPVKASTERRLIDESDSVEGARISQVQARKNAGPSGTKSVARELFASNKDRFYDPLEATFHPKNTKAFEDWYDAAKKLTPEPETPLPLISKPTVKVLWFESLWGRREWLWDEHIDALTNLLLWKYKRAKESFESGWAVMDALGTGFLLHGDFEKTWSSMMQYVNGNWPREGGLRWVEARQVIGVANVSGNHWVCYAICFDSQTVTIYDSQRGDRNWPTIARHFDNMSRYIPWICANAGIWAKKKMGADLREVFEVVSVVEAPQQIGNHDCGIMAVKFMECLASNHDMTSLDPARCGIFRRIYCAQLYELGLEFPAETRRSRGGVDIVEG